MPVAEEAGESAPLATVLGNVKNGIENLQVRKADIATLAWHIHIIVGLLVLTFGNLQHHIIQ